jgi:hypothetical protein
MGSYRRPILRLVALAALDSRGSKNKCRRQDILLTRGRRRYLVNLHRVHYPTAANKQTPWRHLILLTLSVPRGLAALVTFIGKSGHVSPVDARRR